MWFKLINNPLTKMVAGKVVDHFKHRAEKVKTIRQAEIEACKEVDVWYLVIIVFTATFSTKMTDKVLNRNKKK